MHTGQTNATWYLVNAEDSASFSKLMQPYLSRVYRISSLTRFNSLARLTSIFTTSTCCGTRWTSGTHGPTTSSLWTSTRFSFGFRALDISPVQVSASECKKVVREFGETISELNAKDESNEVLTMLENKVRQYFVDQSLEFRCRWQASSPRFLA